MQFAPELLVTLMRRHAGLGTDMGKMREFHGITLFELMVPVEELTLIREDDRAVWSRLIR
ncbi:MAG: hypothetical protein ABSC37_02445 [Xanthobacteraceae bacterium]